MLQNIREKSREETKDRGSREYHKLLNLMSTHVI